MARGHEANKARKEAVNALGRGLARRARSSCELCGVSGQRLIIVEVTPLPEEPDPERAVMVCEICAEGVQGGKLEPGRWRFLENSVWSEVGAVQVTAVRAARRLSLDGAQWAQGLLEGLYLDPEVEAWIDEATV